MAEIKKSFKNLVSRSKWSGFFIMNVKRTLLFIAMPLLIVNSLATFYYYQAVTTDARTSSERIFSTTLNSIQGIFDEVETLFCTIAPDTGVGLFMRTEDVVALDGSTLAVIQQPLKMASTHCSLSGSLDSVELYSYKAGYVLTTQGGGKADSFEDMPWYGVSSNDLSFCVPGKKGFSICYNIVDHMEKNGLMIFNVNPGSFSDSSDNNFSIQIVDKNGKPFYTSGNVPRSLPDLTVEQNHINLKQTNKYTKMTALVDNGVYLYMEVEHNKPIYGSFIWMSLLTLIVLLVSSFVLAYVLSSYNYKFVRDITININEVDPINPDKNMENEITYINQNILRMKDKNQQLEQEVVRSFANLKKMQTQVLQVQFTPHFIFNTLNALNTSLMIKHGADNPESETILILSNLLTSSIDIQHYMVTIEQEINYSDDYLKIQSILSNNNFGVYWDVDENVKKCITVKFVLQPLIENAFKHGIKHLQNKSPGILKISIKKQGNNIVFRVMNNGPLPDENTIQKLNTMLKSSQGNNGNHVGLFNTNNRIKLVFGDNYGCRIGIENGLTAVSITIPALNDFDTN